MNTILENAFKISRQKFNLSLPLYTRFLFDKVINSKDKIIGIYGSRGVGKTTLMLQIAKKLQYKSDEILYISCDHFLFTDVSLFDFVEYFYTMGGKCILIDEIHEAKNFEQELKSIYDFFDLKIFFTGSSAVKLTNASLSRRYAMFKLPILSLKEYCELELNLRFSSYTFEEIVSNHINIANTIIQKLSSNKILKLYNQYLEYGAYPYYFVNEDSYFQKVTDSINTVLYTDIAILYNVSASNIELLKKLLHTICLSKPLELSIESLSKKIGVSKVTLYKYIEYLHKAELLRHIKYEGKRFKSMQKPDKLYLSNTSLFKALCHTCEKGTLRETFFSSSVSFGYSIYYVSKGDFLVNEKYTIEIGGKNKSFNQIKDIENSYVVADDTEVGFQNKIPLWLFGFLY